HSGVSGRRTWRRSVAPSAVSGPAGLRFAWFFMPRRPPTSTLFPYRRSSDLHHVDRRLHLVEPVLQAPPHRGGAVVEPLPEDLLQDRKSTRLNSSHVKISYAVFCLKKKTQTASCHSWRCMGRAPVSTPPECPP